MDIEDLKARVRPTVDQHLEQERARLDYTVKRAWDLGKRVCESEIEVTLLAAWMVCSETSDHVRKRRSQINVRVHGYCDRDDYLRPRPIGRKDVICGIFTREVLIPQFKVGVYRADFAIQRSSRYGAKLSPRVLVECDGHDFHERTKEQAQRDKARDRELQAVGYYVLRFTGSEIWNDAAGCVEQIDAFLDSHLMAPDLAVIDAAIEAEAAAAH
jgi:very-short-patch-repair endonuclease